MLAPYACFQLGPPWLNLRYSLLLTLCEQFSLIRQIIGSLLLCGNVLHKLEILYSSLTRLCFKRNPAESRAKIRRLNAFNPPVHGLQSLPPSPKRAERKGRRRPFREADSGHKQWNTVSCVDTFSIISKFSSQNSKI